MSKKKKKKKKLGAFLFQLINPIFTGFFFLITIIMIERIGESKWVITYVSVYNWVRIKLLL